RRTNPDLFVSGRNADTLQPEQSRLIADAFALGVEILEILAFAFARVTGLVVADVSKTSFLRDFDRIRRNFDLVDFLFFAAQFLRRHRNNTCATRKKVAANSTSSRAAQPAMDSQAVNRDRVYAKVKCANRFWRKISGCGITKPRTARPRSSS